MTKRFTQTEKWRDSWFLSLAPTQKLAWLYLCDECDHAGVIELIPRLAELQIGAEVDWDDFIEICSHRVVKLDDGKFWVRSFVDFQYGTLNRENRVHKSVLNRLESLNLMQEKEGPSKDLTRSKLGPKDKDKDKNKEKDKDNPSAKSNVIDAECRPEVAAVVSSWVEYKTERGEGYKPRGLKAVCSRMTKFADEHGVDALTISVEKAMSANWKGWEFTDARPQTTPAAPDDDVVLTSRFKRQSVGGASK